MSFLSKVIWPSRRVSVLLTVAVLSRLFVFVVALVTNRVFGVSCQTCGNISYPLLNLFSRWDSAYYVHIATHGYSSWTDQYWAFFPAYPVLMGGFGRLLSFLFMIPLDLAVDLAGFVISNLSFLVAVYYLYKLSAAVLGKLRLAFDSAVYLALFPSGVFLSAIYSDSLFILLTISSLYYWQLGRLGRSGILGLFAALTRPLGLLLVLPFIYKILVDSPSRMRIAVYLHTAMIPVGSLVFIVYSWLRTGTAFAFFIAEAQHWRTGMSGSLGAGIENPFTYPFLILGIATLVVSILIERNPRETTYNLHAFCLIITYLLGDITSFPRYSITLLPIYWQIARYSRSLAFRIFIYAVSVTLLAICTGLYVNWYHFFW